MLSDHLPPGSKAQAQVIAPGRDVIERLRTLLEQIDLVELPNGLVGRDFLDALELVDAIRIRMREKAKALLLDDPACLPGWKVLDGIVSRGLSKDALAIYDALAAEDPSLTLESFLTACSTNLTAIRTLYASRHPHLNETEVDARVNSILADLIDHRQSTPRLIRKDKPRLPWRKSRNP